MREHYQLFPYADHSAGVYGDCMRTCIASLLDLPPEDVPHFLHDNSDDWQRDLNAWLAQRNLAYMVLPVPDARDLPQIFALQGLDTYHLIGVRTSNGLCHQIVGRNGKPHWCPVLGDVSGREYDIIELGFITITSLNAGCYTDSNTRADALN